MEKSSLSYLDRIEENETLNIQSFAQKNANYYMKKWSHYEKPFRFSGWNWAAFLLTPFWLSYRHMYDKVLLYFFFIFVASILTIVTPMITYFHMQIPIRIAVTFSLFSFPLIHLFFGWKGNAYYLTHVHRVLEKQHFVPIYRKKGVSLLSALFVPGIFAIVFSLSAFGSFHTLNKNFVPYGVFVTEVDVDQFTLADSLRITKPKFRKYSSSAELFYHGKKDIENEAFQVILSFRENSSAKWEKIDERSYNIFSGNMVTLNLIDGQDPLTKTGEYVVEVFVGGNFAGREHFQIYFK